MERKEREKQHEKTVTVKFLLTSDLWLFFLSQIAQSVKSACVKPFKFFVLSPWTSTPEAPEDVGNETSAVAIYSLHLDIT